MSKLFNNFLKVHERLLKSLLTSKIEYKIKTVLFGLLGIGLSLPFIEQAVPINISNLVFVLGPVLIYVILFPKIVSHIRTIRPDFFSFVLGFTLSIYFIAAINSDLSPLSSVWIAFVYGFIYMMLSIFLDILLDNERQIILIIKYFSLSITIVAVLGAILGLCKLLLYRKGVTLDFVENTRVGHYPNGTSLLSDYNFYGLTLLSGGLFLIKYCFKTVWPKFAFAISFLCMVVICAGVYSGSRRFIVLAPILITLAAIYHFYNCRKTITRIHLISIFTGVVAALILICFLLRITGGLHDGHLSVQIATLGDGGHGLLSRWERWEYAWDLIGNSNIWQINDFRYRETYGCRFVDCIHDDYPHNPILSAALYGGLAGFVSVLVFYVYIFYLLLQLTKIASEHLEILLILLTVVLYTAISGDTLFSMPVLLVSLIIGKMAVVETNRQSLSKSKCRIMS